jgi:hypothetical protein
MTVFLLCLALVAVIALALATLARPRGTADLVVSAYVIGVATIAVTSVGLSLVDRYRRTELVLVLAVLAAGAVMLVVGARPPRPPLPFRPLLATLRAEPLLAVLAAGVSAAVAYEVALALFTPQNDGDALQYHLTRAAFWRQQEAIGYVDNVADVRINAFPPLAEILTSFTMVGSGSVRLVGLVQLTAMLAAACAVYGIARRVGVGTRGALLGGLLFLTLPIVALQASTAFNDVVVASFAAAAAFFVLGRSRTDVVLVGTAFGLLVATKVTAALAVPALLALVLATPGARRRAEVIAAGAIGALLGAGWYALNLDRTGDLFGTFPAEERGSLDLPSITARATRQLINVVSLPGAVGVDILLYAVAAAVLLAAGLVAARRGRSSALPAVVACALALTPFLLVPLESVLLRGYQKVWHTLGRDDLGGLDPGRDLTRAGVMFSWYGPLSLLLALLAATLAVRRWRRGELPPAILVLAAAPIAWILALAVAVTYFEWNGRFTMGGFALSAATWGLVLEERRLRPAAWAAVAIGLTTVLLTLVHYDEKPSGLRLVESTGRSSVWTTPRWVLQATGAGHGDLIREVEARVPPGDAIAIWPSPTPSGGVWATVPPYPYFGDPTITRRVELARTPGEAERRGARWAILPAAAVAGCAPGWRIAYSVADWHLLERDAAASCDGG